MARTTVLAICLAVALVAPSCAHRHNYSVASVNCTNQTFIVEVRSQTYNSEVPFILIAGQLKGEDAISVPPPPEITVTWHAEGQTQASATYRLDGAKEDAFDPDASDTLLFVFCPGAERPALLSEARRSGRGLVLYDWEKHTVVNGLSINSACEVCGSGTPRYRH